MRAIIIVATSIVLAGCSSSYWQRPGATLPELAQESEACFQSSLDQETPAAFPGSGPANPLLPRTQPPPKLWDRSPREAGFERFDEQARYERCMRVRGWQHSRY
jgi:hypothetical protein